jgi:hypothetical protein
VTDEPLLRVERGEPTDEELTALVAVIATKLHAGAPAPAPSRGRSEWANPARAVRQPHRPGPGRWRTATFPR